jgi:hypothetical protein
MEIRRSHSERWKNVICEMDAGRTDCIGDWVSKDVATRDRATTYIHTYI